MDDGDAMMARVRKAVMQRQTDVGTRFPMHGGESDPYFDLLEYDFIWHNLKLYTSIK